MDPGAFLFTGNAQVVGRMGANGHKESLKAFLPQLFEGHIPAETGIEPEFHAQGFYHGRFAVDDFPGQAVARNAHQGHAAGKGQGFNDPHVIPFQRQVIGGTHTGRSRPHDTHLAVIGLCLDRILILPPGQGPLGGKGLEKFYRNRCIDAAPDAHELTGPGADQAANPGKRIVPPDDLDGFGILAHGNQGNICGYVDTGRTGHLAGGRGQIVAIAGGAVVGPDMALEDLPMAG